MMSITSEDTFKRWKARVGENPKWSLALKLKMAWTGNTCAAQLHYKEQLHKLGSYLL